MKMFLSLCVLSFMLSANFYGTPQENENEKDQSTAVIAKTKAANQDQKLIVLDGTNFFRGSCTFTPEEITLPLLQSLFPIVSVDLSSQGGGTGFPMRFCMGFTVQFENCDISALHSSVTTVVDEYNRRALSVASPQKSFFAPPSIGTCDANGIIAVYFEYQMGGTHPDGTTDQEKDNGF